MQLGDTFLFNVEKAHLWIVVTDPSKNSGSFIIMNLTTDSWRAGTDCELNIGDHPWIREKCWVNFGDAQEVTPIEEAKMMAYMGSGLISQNHPMSALILAKIAAVAKTTKALKIKYRNYF
jgi:hypothetical protein